MNAPATFPRTIRVDQTPAEVAAHADMARYFPDADEMTIAIRADIAAFRDRASAGYFRCCEEAEPLIGEIARLGTAWAFAPGTAGQLMMRRSALHLAMEAACQIERAKADGR